MQKLFQVTCLTLACFGLSATAQAFTVENMSAWSNANQPLRMDIELADLAITNANEVQVRVASEEEHARLGLTRPSWANDVRFQMISLPKNHVVARASTTSAISDDRVSFVVSISTPSEGRLQQVGSNLGQPPLASKNPPAERTISVPSKKPAVVATAQSVSSVKLTEPAPQAKPFNPAVESRSVANTATAPAKSMDKPAAAAPAAASPAVALKPAPAKAPAPEKAPVPAKAASPAKVATTSITASSSGQDRTALEQGLKAAKAQVADLEAQIAALTKVPATTPDANAAASAASAPAPAAADSEIVMAPADELVVLDVEGVEPEAVSTETDAQNAQALAAATVANEQALAEPEVVALKPYQLFARFMILVVGLILLVFFLIDKVRNRR